MVSIGWVRFDSFPDQELIAEKNLTLLIKFGIILIESERDFTLHFATIAPKGLKVIHMV